MEENTDLNHDLNTDVPPVAASPATNGANNSALIAGAIVLAGVMIAGAILLKDRLPASNVASLAESAEINFRNIENNEHVLGNPSAPIKIIEYSDTECPFCKYFHQTLHEIVEGNNNVAWIYRHFPIAALHEKAFHEAEATECAWELGGNDMFWKYIDEVFIRTGSNDSLPASELSVIAKDLGLDTTLFNTCLASGKHAQKIEADIEDGASAGASGTPYSLVVSKDKISSKKQREILKLIENPAYVTFASNNEYVLSLNGALPLEMVEGIIEILSE